MVEVIVEVIVGEVVVDVAVVADVVAVVEVGVGWVVWVGIGHPKMLKNVLNADI